MVGSVQRDRAAARSGGRVLHVIKSLPYGGIETWLVHLLRHRDKFDVKHEILLMNDDVAPYEPEVRRMGVTIHKLAMDGGWIKWFRDFGRFLRHEGPFEAVHSHLVTVAAAPLLFIAAATKVPIRIAHSHEARSQGADFLGLRRKIMHRVGSSMIRRFSTRRIGISEAAIEEFAGPDWEQDPHASVLLYGFDFSANDGAAERAMKVRTELGIPADAKILGHVGRFAPVKNHEFVLRTFAALCRLRDDVHLVLVGTGPLVPSIRELAEELRIGNQVHFAGTTRDVAGFMSLFDVFLFPSYSEGLGIVALEAQAAGTPTLMTDSLPHEVIVVAEGVERLPLAAGPEFWAEAVNRRMDRPAPDAGDWRRRVEASRFGIARCVDELNEVYREEMVRAG